MDTFFEYTQDESQSINYLYDEPYMSRDNNWEEEIIQDHFGISDLYDLCLEPSLRDGFSQVIYLLMWCIFLRGAIHFRNVIKRGPAKQGYVHSQLKHWHLTEGFKGKCKTENNFTCGQHFNKEELVSSSKVIRGPKAAARQMYGLIAHMMGHGDLAASCPCGVKDSGNIWVLSVIHLGLIGIWSNDRSTGSVEFVCIPPIPQQLFLLPSSKVPRKEPHKEVNLNDQASFYPLLCHLLSICVGVINLQTYFSLTMWYILLLAFIGYITLYLVSSYLKKHRGPILGITCFSFLIFCEFYLVEEMEWHKIRGAQMLLVMRIISIAFDTDFGTLEHIPSPFEFMGYICCCGTCIFGPWIPYKNYISLCDRTPLSYKLFVKIAVCLVISFFFLSLSTCWLNWLIPDGSWRWLIAYRDAFAFRSSHYFISFLSEASTMISGFGNETDSIWSFAVTSPLSIEAPRSLVEVVIYWNRPMHYWFKTYVFRSTRPLGSVAAVLSTYIVSILMHGLNFQLAAVLFSLGVYTYVEFTLRHKLAQVFDACIEAHPCRQRCSHRHKAKQLSTKLANVGFGVLTMFHLSYLGVMFDMSSTLQEKGYSYSHTLSKWSNLHFASLWVVLGTYIFYLLI